MRKTFIAPFIGLFMLVSTALAVGPTTQSVSAATPGCNENSIINCGAHSTTELRAKYKANTTGDLDNVYSHYGISAAMINGDMKTGTLTRDGNVVVDGKVVATGAETVGRHYLNGSKTVKIGNGTYYQRSTSISLSRDSAVFVWFDADGKYIGSLIQYCGNPVKATPKPVPPKPAPVAACVSLTATKISRNVYKFTGTASTANGATISGYTLTVTAADGSTQTLQLASTSKTVTSGNVTVKEGDSTAKLAVKTSAGVKESAGCVVKVTVTPLPPEKVDVCDPKTGDTITVDKKDQGNYKPVGDIACEPVKVCDPETKQVITVKPTEADNYKPVGDEACTVQGVTVEELPSTGPAEMLGGGLGLTSLTAAGYYWRASRKQFISKLLGN